MDRKTVQKIIGASHEDLIFIAADLVKKIEQKNSEIEVLKAVHKSELSNAESKSYGLKTKIENLTEENQFNEKKIEKIDTLVCLYRNLKFPGREYYPDQYNQNPMKIENEPEDFLFLMQLLNELRCYR